jgi:predicted phosphodiesterase
MATKLPLPKKPITRFDHKQYLVITDNHIPFHNVVLTLKVLELAKYQNFHGLVIGGDFLDLFCISKHAQGSLLLLQGLTLGQEFKAGNMVLDMLDEVGFAEKHFLFGNHEDRYERWLQKGDNAIVADAIRSPQEALKLEERGYKVYPNWKSDIVKIAPDLDIIHGLWTNIHAAKKHLEEADRDVIFGHTHRFQTYHTAKKTGYNIGGLFDKNGLGLNYANIYVRTNKWVNGFGVVTVFDDGQHYIEPIPVNNNNVFVYGGRVY